MKKEGKIWGENILVFFNDNIQINQAYIKKGGRCSKHKHVYKNNIFYVQSGKLEIEQWSGDFVDKTILKTNESTEIKAGIYHRFTGLEDTILLEIYEVNNNSIDLNDIIRDDCGTIVKI